MPGGGGSLGEFYFILKIFLPPPLENKTIFQDPLPPTISLELFQAPPPLPHTPIPPPIQTQTLNRYTGG